MIEALPSFSSPQVFGTDGIRGLANRYPMSPDFVLKLGQVIGIYFKKYYENPHILIGKDTRRSGYMLEQALSSGICSVGVHSLLIGPLPTPGIAYMTRGMRANAGIVISASHNPYHDNGIKIFSADGYKLPDDVEMRLEKMLASELADYPLPTGKGIGTSQRIDDAIGQYAVFLKEQFPKHLTLEGLRIVLDTANGAGYKVGPKVLKELGAELFHIGASPDGTNINDHSGALDPAELAAKVKLYKADIGIAVDGDADRLVVVDEQGVVLGGDEILAICGTYYLEKNRLRQNTLVSTVMSNMGLDVTMARHGGRVIRTQVGDRHVVEVMRRENLNFGGEQSGHLIFRDSSTTGDGLLGALAVLEIMLEKQRKVSELKTCMEALPQVIRSIDVKEKVPLSELPNLRQMIQEYEAQLTGQGRILFRYSGTERKARIMIEGLDLTQIECMVTELAQVVLGDIAQHLEKRG